MDPLSQAVLGASLPVALTRKSEAKTALICGALAGMLPDLDVFIASKADPLLALEFHRQFTHSLLFIPLGGLIAALCFKYILRMKLSLTRIYWYSLLGYATHGLLDACTTYGTQLFWPFSNTRVAWNTVSIIDPLFTLTLIGLLFFYKNKSQLWRTSAFAFALTYLSIGFLQNHRAQKVAFQIAKDRQHSGYNFEVYPTIGNLLVWRSVYEYNDEFYVDAIRVGWTHKVYPGSSVPKLNVKRDFPSLPIKSVQFNDVQRFQWFTNQHAYKIKEQSLIGDIRYSMSPYSTAPMWGITITPDSPNIHVKFSSTRKSIESPIKKFIKLLFGENIVSRSSKLSQ